MFPGIVERAEANSPEHQAKYKAGPRGVVTFMPEIDMGRNLGLTLTFFLVASFCLAYLATIVMKPGAEGLTVFRFFATAGLMTFLPGIVLHSIWFRGRIVGHVLESLMFAAIVGGVFAGLWPKA